MHTRRAWDPGNMVAFESSNKLMNCGHFCRVSIEWHLLLEVERVRCSELNVNHEASSTRQSTGTASVSVHFYGRMSKRAAC